MHTPTDPDTPGDRPRPLPAKAIIGCAMGIFGVTVLGPDLLSADITYHFAGENWLNIMFPYVILPMGAATGLAMITIPRLIRRGSLTGLKIFRAYAYASIIFYVLCLAFTAQQCHAAPNPGAAAFYLIETILFVLGLPFPLIFLRTLLKYRWLDPASRPSEWEQPEPQQLVQAS